MEVVKNARTERKQVTQISRDFRDRFDRDPGVLWLDALIDRRSTRCGVILERSARRGYIGKENCSD